MIGQSSALMTIAGPSVSTLCLHARVCLSCDEMLIQAYRQTFSGGSWCDGCGLFAAGGPVDKLCGRWNSQAADVTVVRRRPILIGIDVGARAFTLAGCLKWSRLEVNQPPQMCLEIIGHLAFLINER